MCVRITFGRPLPIEYLRFSASEPASLSPPCAGAAPLAFSSSSLFVPPIPRITPSRTSPIEISASVHSPGSWHGRVGPQPSPRSSSYPTALYALEGRSLNFTPEASPLAQGTSVPTNPASAVELPRWWDAKTVALLQGVLHHYWWPTNMHYGACGIEAKACEECCSGATAILEEEHFNLCCRSS